MTTTISCYMPAYAICLQCYAPRHNHTGHIFLTTRLPNPSATITSNPHTVSLHRPAASTSSLHPPLRVAYHGLNGSYSELAALRAYPNCIALTCEQIEAALEAVALTHAADRAVLPVENSLEGSIHRNYDLLLRHNLHIVAEVQLPVSHCLLCMHGVQMHEIVRVISHPHALAHCEQTLTRLLGTGFAREAVNGTAGGAQFVSEHALADTATIARREAARLYGLQVLAEAIQDDAGNMTWFVMLAREPIIPGTDRPFKTSIVLAHHDSSRTLFKVLAAFAFRQINLTKIESRPRRTRPLRRGLSPPTSSNNNMHTTHVAEYFEYLFYIDFEASMAEPRAQNAVAEVQQFVTFLRILGSYPMDMTPLPPPQGTGQQTTSYTC